MVASSGWNAGGSWIPPEHAGKGLYHSATAVTGPKKVQLELPLPDLPKECPRDAGGRPVYLREVAVLAVPRHPSKVLSGVDQVLDLTNRVDGKGNLRWDVPEGDWDILRFVCSNHGQPLIVPSPNSGGPMIDFFDPRATEFHLQHIVSTILKVLERESFEGTSFQNAAPRLVCGRCMLIPDAAVLVRTGKASPTAGPKFRWCLHHPVPCLSCSGNPTWR